MKDEVVVYWSLLTNLDRQTLLNLLVEPPKPLYKTIGPGPAGRTDGNYRMCGAAGNVFNTTFVLTNPHDTEVELSGPVEDPQINGEEIWEKRANAMQDRYAVDYDMRWVFFCEEPLTMKVITQYMHNTSFLESAHVATGQFDISRWFRGINPCFILWKDKNKVVVKKDEPLMYVEFLTEKRIVLKQFELTQELNDIASQVGTITKFIKMEPLSSLYDRFTRTNRGKRVIKLIKENLL